MVWPNEGAHRVPFIAWWPDKIDKGIETDETAITMDLYPTFQTLVNAPRNDQKVVNRIPLNTHIFEGKALPNRTLFWKMDDEIAMREGHWKFVKIGSQPAELYNLKDDIGEIPNMLDSHPKITTNL